MKKKWTLLFSTLALMVLFCNLLVAQQTETEKRIVVTIRSTAADGSKTTSTMTVTGEDAANFDVKKYIAEQTKDKPDAVVIVNKNGATRSENRSFNSNSDCNTNSNANKNWDNKTFSHTNKTTNYYNNSPRGFLGVSELDNDSKDVEGLRVSITRNSGAAKAGLKDDDVILQLNKTPINSYRDLTVFMRTTKPGDKVEIVYDREGKTKTTTATLGNPQDSWGQYVEQEKEACLGVYSSSHAVDAQRGAIINDFTKVSAAQEVKMQIGDVITSVNGMRVKSHQDVWDEIAKYKPNESVRVAYLRDNASQEIRATLKACKPRTANDDKVIVVPKNPETQQAIVAPANLGKLELNYFAASPNPTKGMVNVNFQGMAVPTTVSFYDLTGKVLFQQNVTDFNGEYNQRFDLNEYAKGIVLIKVQQGDKVFSKQIVIN